MMLIWARRRFLRQVTLERVTLTIPHLAKVICLLYHYLVGLMVIVRVSYGYRYTRGSDLVGSNRSINNGTDINARCARSNSLRKL